MNAEQILAITNPAALFPQDAVKAKEQLRRLRSRWHSDRAGRDDVFTHITKLYELATGAADSGVWDDGRSVTFFATDGRQFILPYLVTRPMEIGRVYIGSKAVAYLVHRDYGDLASNLHTHLSSARFADSDMRKEVIRYLPTVKTLTPLREHVLVVLGKDPDCLCLRDILTYMGGNLPPRHAAWILGRLYNLITYFSWANIVHGDLSPDTLFISPQRHIGMLVGGWWYTSRAGQKFKALPQRTITHMPASELASGVAGFKTDSNLVRATGRELLGDITGGKLLYGDAPMPMVNWLKMPGTGKALTEFEQFYQTLEKSFGARRFVELGITEKDIYER